MPSYSFSRPLVQFNDGSTAVSPFAEFASSGVWVTLGPSSNPFEYIFQGPFGSNDPTAYMFNAGDPSENQIVGAWSNSTYISLAGVAPGDYVVNYYAITWDTFGFPDNTLAGLSEGNFQQFDTGTMLVTPEPASYAIFGIGLLGLLARRRNK